MSPPYPFQREDSNVQSRAFCDVRDIYIYLIAPLRFRSPTSLSWPIPHTAGRRLRAIKVHAIISEPSRSIDYPMIMWIISHASDARVGSSRSMGTRQPPSGARYAYVFFLPSFLSRLFHRLSLTAGRVHVHYIYYLQLIRARKTRCTPTIDGAGSHLDGARAARSHSHDGSARGCLDSCAGTSPPTIQKINELTKSKFTSSPSPRGVVPAFVLCCADELGKTYVLELSRVPPSSALYSTSSSTIKKLNAIHVTAAPFTPIVLCWLDEVGAFCYESLLSLIKQFALQR
ncbi:hypothetical protein C8R45DRAFT_1091426 [Mycena sanguinolenta]|nr:hypothetical protein C8R45DRAFT_1091426 [Mycena sanguinolenta]